MQIHLLKLDMYDCTSTIHVYKIKCIKLKDISAYYDLYIHHSRIFDVVYITHTLLNNLYHVY